MGCPQRCGEVELILTVDVKGFQVPSKHEMARLYIISEAVINVQPATWESALLKPWSAYAK